MLRGFGRQHTPELTATPLPNQEADQPTAQIRRRELQALQVLAAAYSFCMTCTPPILSVAAVHMLLHVAGVGWVWLLLQLWMEQRSHACCKLPTSIDSM